MPNIKIREQDLTSGGSRAVNRDIVYIPGFPGVSKGPVVKFSTTGINSSVVSINRDKFAQKYAEVPFPINQPIYYTGNGTTKWQYFSISELGITATDINLVDYGIDTGENSGISWGINTISVVDASGALVSEELTLASGSGTPLLPDVGTATFWVGASAEGTEDDPNVTLSFNINRNYPIDVLKTYDTATSGVPAGSVLKNAVSFSNITPKKIISLAYEEETYDTEYMSYLTDTDSQPEGTLRIPDCASFTVTSFSANSVTWLDNGNMPYICNTLSEFNDIFGNRPVRFSDSNASIEGITVVEGDCDKSYIMAIELLNRGMPVLYHAPYSPEIASESISSDKIENFKVALMSGTEADPGSSINNLYGRSDFDVKYITSGAYPLFIIDSPDKSYCNKVLSICGKRGDCYALIDHSESKSIKYTPISDSDSLYSQVATAFGSDSNANRGAMFTPWYFYSNQAFTDTNPTTKERNNTPIMPASFAYLTALADSMVNNPNWYAIAGVNRGIVPNFAGVYLDRAITNTVANAMQPRGGSTSINAITYIRPYGNTIWGNRTLKNNTIEGNLTATSFLNIRNMICDVAKVAYETATGLLFEQDTSILWINFIAGISPTLDKMVGTGLRNYRIIREPSEQKAEIKAIIRLYPIEAVEDFDITIELRDDEVIVS